MMTRDLDAMAWFHAVSHQVGLGASNLEHLVAAGSRTLNPYTLSRGIPCFGMKFCKLTLAHEAAGFEFGLAVPQSCMFPAFP